MCCRQQCAVDGQRASGMLKPYKAEQAVVELHAGWTKFFFQAEDGIRDPLWSRGLGMESGALEAAIADHNTGDIPNKLTTPPYYALGPAKSYIVLTDGGLTVNENLQLLGHGDTPIPGLWAAGSAGQGGLILKGHGHHIGWAFTSGRIAGRIAGRHAAAASRGNG